jgi:ParB family chromosome partitioning protein
MNEKSNAQLINQDSKKVEYYTPSWIVEAAREVMGSIDLDPASSAEANKIVKAKEYYSTKGLFYVWSGNLWLNHPFNKKENKLWIDRLIHYYEITWVKQACCIAYASTSEKWFQPLMNYPQCYFNKRVNYIDGLTGLVVKGVTKGSVVTYLGPNVEKFNQVFSQYGKIMMPYGYSL